MEIKTFKANLEFKAEDKGQFEAVFATMNVIDLDDDVTLPGAFGDQKVMIEPWNHNYQAPPVGKGQIFERDDEAIVKGSFFLDTPAGKEHYTVAKELQDIQEFSYTFNILDADFGVFEGKEVRFLKKMEVIGVGQVARGAGLNTHTVYIKSGKNGDNEGEADDGAGVGKPSDDDLWVRIDLAELAIIMFETEVDRA